MTTTRHTSRCALMEEPWYMFDTVCTCQPKAAPGDIYHVYHPPARGKTFSVDMPEGHRAVYYGHAITGRPCSKAILHDLPRDGADLRWIDGELYCRLAPGATVEEFDEHSRQAREAREQ